MKPFIVFHSLSLRKVAIEHLLFKKNRRFAIKPRESELPTIRSNVTAPIKQSTKIYVKYEYLYTTESGC